jgi:hypothetical protein
MRVKMLSTNAVLFSPLRIQVSPPPWSPLPVQIHLLSRSSKIRVVEVIDRSISEIKCRLVSRDHHAIPAVQYCIMPVLDSRRDFSRGCFQKQGVLKLMPSIRRFDSFLVV